MTPDERIDGPQVRDALERVLFSRTFARSERLRSFLKFIVEMEQRGLAHQLKGYTIGIDVFSRGDGFDPGTDPLVRVQAGKLRKLLDLYYASEGCDEPLRIYIPTGSYVPIYERVSKERNSRQEGFPLDIITAPFSHAAGSGPGNAPYAFPRLFIRKPAPGDRLVSVFVNATRLWTNRLWAVPIAGPDERPVHEHGAVHPLHFELTAEGIGTHTLKLGLRHLRSGAELMACSGIHETTGDAMELGIIANQFAATHLTIAGSIYRFCNKHSLATGQMKCLDATYRYTLEMTDAAYLSARQSQQQWAGLGPSSEIITEIPALISMASLAR
jgi:hypothetical protein